jgi:hypothetical protein
MESHRRGSKDLRGARLRQSGSLSFNRQSRVGVGRVDKVGLASIVSSLWKGSDARTSFECRMQD